MILASSSLQGGAVPEEGDWPAEDEEAAAAAAAAALNCVWR